LFRLSTKLYQVLSGNRCFFIAQAPAGTYINSFNLFKNDPKIIRSHVHTDGGCTDNRKDNEVPSFFVPHHFLPKKLKFIEQGRDHLTIILLDVLGWIAFIVVQLLVNLAGKTDT